MSTHNASATLRRPTGSPDQDLGASQVSEVQLDDAGDLVEIRGLSLTEVSRAVQLLFAAERLQDRFEARADADVLASMAGANMPLVRSEHAAATARTAQLRSSLIQDTQNWFTYGGLATLRDSTESATRTWVARKRESGQLITIRVDGNVLIPSVQIAPNGRLRPEIGALVQELSASELDSWSIWAWLTSPSEWLSGDVPATVAAENPDRATRAATRYAATVKEGIRAHRRSLDGRRS